MLIFFETDIYLRARLRLLTTAITITRIMRSTTTPPTTPPMIGAKFRLGSSLVSSGVISVALGSSVPSVPIHSSTLPVLFGFLVGKPGQFKSSLTLFSETVSPFTFSFWEQMVTGAHPPLGVNMYVERRPLRHSGEWHSTFKSGSNSVNSVCFALSRQWHACVKGPLKYSARALNLSLWQSVVITIRALISSLSVLFVSQPCHIPL